MENITGFNVRVYGICIRENKLLTLREIHGTWDIIKLPGGGLEYGEGSVECLVREFKEELNLDIAVGDCFYIQRDYVKSVVNDCRQILMLYYLVDILNVASMEIKVRNIVSVDWLEISDKCPLDLPVDIAMYDKLRNFINDK